MTPQQQLIAALLKRQLNSDFYVNFEMEMVFMKVQYTLFYLPFAHIVNHSSFYFDILCHVEFVPDYFSKYLEKAIFVSVK